MSEPLKPSRLRLRISEHAGARAETDLQPRLTRGLERHGSYQSPTRLSTQPRSGEFTACFLSLAAVFSPIGR